MLAAIGFAFYVAVSWTWVIGMFLPVLLVRDFGLWGWVAFAVPNVVGAASVGFLLRTPRRSAELVVTHLKAVALFSAITMAFQMVTLGWLIGSLSGDAPYAGMAFLLPVGVMSLLPTLRPSLRRHCVAAVIVWLLSAGVAAWLAGQQWLTLPPMEHQGAGPIELAALACVTSLGFLLCPYLDVTFHAARQATGDRSRLAFGLGFFVLFPAMIAFTLGYAGKLPGLMKGMFDDFDNGLASLLILIHLIVQVIATNFFHAAALRRTADALGDAGRVARPGLSWMASLVILALFGWLLSRPPFSLMPLFGHSAGEFVYRAFIGFYGLPFPAYVLLVMLGRASMRAFWLTCLTASPLMALGFFGGPGGWSMAWGAAGVTVVIVAFLVTRRRAPESLQPPAGH